MKHTQLVEKVMVNIYQKPPENFRVSQTIFKPYFEVQCLSIYNLLSIRYFHCDTIIRGGSIILARLDTDPAFFSLGHKKVEA